MPSKAPTASRKASAVAERDGPCASKPFRQNQFCELGNVMSQLSNTLKDAPLPKTSPQTMGTLSNAEDVPIKLYLYLCIHCVCHWVPGPVSAWPPDYVMRPPATSRLVLARERVSLA